MFVPGMRSTGMVSSYTRRTTVSDDCVAAKKRRTGDDTCLCDTERHRRTHSPCGSGPSSQSGTPV